VAALIAGGGLVGLGLAGGYLLRGVLGLARPSTGVGMMTGGMMGNATSADMGLYMDLFNRHSEIRSMKNALVSPWFHIQPRP